MDQDIKSLNGVMLIDKEIGISSYDVIRRLKKMLFEQYGLEGRERRQLKIGHAGTLDPFASGLLIVMLGKATKLNDTLHALEKEYLVEATFGYETDTQDPTGEVIAKLEDDKVATVDYIRSAIEGMTGELLQTPPAYSAKKISGKPSYKYARKGEIHQLEARKIKVSSWELTQYNWPVVEFKVVVSTGTYVRTLIVDLARGLGSMATATQLRRTRVGEFLVDEALSSSNITVEQFNEKFIKLADVNERLQKAILPK
ncbi:MAG: tRNA pseudouridine(55) synthase TruB [Candidatus Dojkabacteria bacterium]|nr:MAG: tRNA pseudouridine(55) synthase TruB [Candidatus Dojkabacteria bacterium]